MAYTRTWDNTTPTGASQISAGDDAIRALKVDLDERISSAFEDIDADPLVLKETSLPAVSGGVQFIPGTMFQPHHDDDDIEHHIEYYRSDNNAGFQLYAGFHLPPNYQITAFESGVSRSSGTSVTVKLYKVDFLTGTSTLVATNTHTNVSYGVEGTGIDLTPDDILTDEDSYWSIEVEDAAGGTFRMYGCKVTYVPVAA